MSIDLKRFLNLALIVLMAACSPQKSAEKGTAGVQGKSESAGQASSGVQPAPASDAFSGYSIQLVPDSANRNSVLATIPHGFDATGVTIDWLVNGGPVATGPAFKATETKRGDSVQAKATVQGRDILSNIVEIGNTPPELTRIKLMPEIFRPGDVLYVEAAASDLDGDDVSILYEWTKNGQPAGSGKSIDGAVRRGDRITVKITPFDNAAYGQPIVLRREIMNMPPMITSDKDFSFDGGVWTCHIKAVDPDGDPLTFSLKSAPQGMTINPDTGLLTWHVPADFKGKTSCTVTASDGKGGVSSYTVNVNVGEIRK